MNYFVNFSIKMDYPLLEKTLKQRSGKSLKCVVKRMISFTIEQNVLFLVLLANVDFKFGVLMLEEEKQKFCIEIEKGYLIRNLLYLERKDDIPIFKVEKSSSFRLSLLSLEGTKDFSKKEISALQNMNVDLHYSDLPAQPPIQEEQPSKVNEREFKKVLCLREFLENYESKAKNKQFVEVELFE